MKNITLGKYVPYNSLIHRLDSRFKLFALVALIACIFFQFESYYMNFFMYGIYFIFIYVIMRISHISLKMLFSQLKPMWFMIIVLLLVNVLMPANKGDGSGFYFFNTSFKIYYAALYNTLYIVLRIIIMLSLTLVLTATTKPLELTNALEWVMTPLKYIKFPVHEIAMTISLALRFIPTLLEETDRIMKAQASRGVDYEHGKFKEKVRGIISLIIPLFISAFQRSEELASAMEARGYNPSAERTKYRISKWHNRDTISMIVVLIILGGSITLLAMHIDVIAWIASWPVFKR